MITWRSTKRRGKARWKDERCSGGRVAREITQRCGRHSETFRQQAGRHYTRMVKTRDFSCDAEVHELVDAFQSGSIAPAQFNHAAHMATALAYLAGHSFFDAQERMRSTLLQFTARQGINVYHETITTFWMRLLDHLARGPYRDVPLWARINLIVKRWEHAGVLEAHYSRELIHSKAARQSWVLPDRLPFEF
jgi:hypothetical protein